MKHAIAVLKAEREREAQFLTQDTEAETHSESPTWRRMARDRIPVRLAIIDELDDAIEVLEDKA
jgi:hypothetical protein